MDGALLDMQSGTFALCFLDTCLFVGALLFLIELLLCLGESEFATVESVRYGFCSSENGRLDELCVNFQSANFECRLGQSDDID